MKGNNYKIVHIINVSLLVLILTKMTFTVRYLPHV